MIFTDDFLQARWYYQGRKRKVRLGVLHATQSPERKAAARGVARDFATRIAAKKASAHVVIDNKEIIGCVGAGDTAFAVPNANADGFHIEQVGYSEQEEIDWLDTYSQDVIERAASCARQASELFGLPKVWLSVEDVKAGKAGWTDHATCSKALGGDHWDPGPNYPREQFMALLRLDPTEDDFMAHLSDQEQDALVLRVAAIQQATDDLKARALTPDEREALFGKQNGLYAKVTKLQGDVDRIITKLRA